MAALALADGDAEGCQSQVFAQLNRFGGGSDWSFHSFLLLAESYIAQKDYFQARSSVEQLQSNIQTDWVQEACMDLLDRIVQLEQPSPSPADTTSGGNNPNLDSE